MRILVMVIVACGVLMGSPVEAGPVGAVVKAVSAAGKGAVKGVELAGKGAVKGVVKGVKALW